MKQRFYGLNQTKVDLIRDFYKSGNDAFAQKVWRKDWDEIYKKPTRNMNMFKLSSLRDRKQKRYMIKLINQVLVDIKRDKPVVFECHS